MGLKGQLSRGIEQLSELQTLDLSYNKQLTGPLPQSIGNLKKLSHLILAGCSFFGQIPGTIGSLQELVVLSLNSNHLNGVITPSIGNLSKLDWLDLTDNNIEGTIPVSNESSPGLDMLVQCRHLHPSWKEQAHRFNSTSAFQLKCELLDSNKLSGSIPSTLGLVRTLQVVNMRNNSFEVAHFPSWFSALWSLKTLVMEDTQLEGQIPVELFSLPHLETFKLKNNELGGTLEIVTSYSSHLRLIDLQGNLIREIENSTEVKNVQIV
ncbi:LRR domain containing protein [Parasponia andersonii]|uniref:LRR domain containing protein n=1 Tax=Parasponia andersonii TaxID=3476 RepID=A0A2P5AQ65_PARAD|nr:LRR domain containing protein [Parasponia andersonii]